MKHPKRKVTRISMQEAYKPNPRIVDRAVALWIEMLRAPKYDNLGPNSPEGFGVVLSNTMASVLAHAAPKNNTPEVLARFGAELKEILLHGLAITNLGYTRHHVPTWYTRHHVPTRLCADYEPDTYLATAAKRAGLEMRFPWKTSMTLDGKSLSVTNGYGAPQEYHYPLSGDRWLATRLCGEDIPKIIALVESGVLTPELKAGVFAGVAACPQCGHEFDQYAAQAASGRLLPEDLFRYGWRLLCRVAREEGHCLTRGCGRDTLAYWVFAVCKVRNPAWFYRRVLREAVRRGWATKTTSPHGYSIFSIAPRAAHKTDK